MYLDYLKWYLIGVNVVTFFLFAIDLHRHTRTGKTIKPVWIFMALTILGGALGTNLYFLAFFPKFIRAGVSKKRAQGERDYYLYWRVVAAVALILQIVFVLYVFGVNIEPLFDKNAVSAFCAAQWPPVRLPVAT